MVLFAEAIIVLSKNHEKSGERDSVSLVSFDSDREMGVRSHGRGKVSWTNESRRYINESFICERISLYIRSFHDLFAMFESAHLDSLLV